jgi:hypothetical protein
VSFDTPLKIRQSLILFLQAFTNLPAKVGVTATLTLKYRAPTRADQVRDASYFHAGLTDLPSLLFLKRNL